jgi:hypothetical protein
LKAFFAMGTGKSLADSHWVAFGGLGNQKCNGVYQIMDKTPSRGLVDVNVSLDCGGKTGGEVAAPFKFVLDGQKLDGCSLFSHNGDLKDGVLLCGPSQHATDECAKLVFHDLATTFPQASLSVPTFIFHPK